jgi:hypothetical protein
MQCGVIELGGPANLSLIVPAPPPNGEWPSESESIGGSFISSSSQTFPLRSAKYLAHDLDDSSAKSNQLYPFKSNFNPQTTATMVKAGKFKLLRLPRHPGHPPHDSGERIWDGRG